MSTATPSVLQLYRGILKAAKTFPSMKRLSLIASIKQEFHENKVCCMIKHTLNEPILWPEVRVTFAIALTTQGLTDPAKLKHSLAIAVRGLSDLEAYLPQTTVTGESASSVTLKGMTE